MKYHLENLSRHGWIYIEIRKGVPCIKQSGKVANSRLVYNLEKYGYAPYKCTPALWRHAATPVVFTLCVDSFGVKYVGKQHNNHLFDSLRARYNITCDWNGSLYLDLTTYWDYNRRRVKISMPEYNPNVLLRFKHLPHIRNQDIPHACGRVVYSKSQYPTQEDSAPKLPPTGILHIQQVVESLLYYDLAVECTLVVALSDLASEQLNASTKVHSTAKS